MLPAYTLALSIFEATLKAECKQVVQLRSWAALAHMMLRKFHEAKKWNDSAEGAAKLVFGDASWECHRILIDRVHILQGTVATAGQGAQSAETRKAYAMAERVETNAKIFKEQLQEARTVDDAMHSLAYFAPRCRLKMMYAQKQGRNQGGRRSHGQEDKTAGGAGKSRSTSPASLAMAQRAAKKVRRRSASPTEGQPAPNGEMDKAAALIQGAAASAVGPSSADLQAAAALIQGAAASAVGPSSADLQAAAALIQGAAASAVGTS